MLKTLKKILRVVLTKTFAFGLLAALQLIFFFLLMWYFATGGAVTYVIITIITVLVLITLQEKDDLNPAYKLMWTVVVIVMPVFGTLFYLLWGHRNMPRRVRRKMHDIEQRAQAALVQEPAVMDALQREDFRLGQSARYLQRFTASPVYPACGSSEYYPIGEAFFPRFLQELEKAERYIFLEYYILEEGVMLDSTVEVLRRKAAQGVDVRFLWDGFGSMFTLPGSFKARLESYGIKCGVFIPLQFTIHISHYAMLNHRNHRKITVIDGKVGFSGGLNLADEYINVKERFGQWKDTAFMIRGQAVGSLAAIFLRSWDYVHSTITTLSDFLPAYPPVPPGSLSLATGYVQPYWDSPLDGENVSENAYLNIIRHAKDYVYISTPYLILDHEMITSLTLAAKSGVDVRILTPAIPDKPTVFLVTQSFYPALLREGVRIYEYTPGFNHAKMYVSDDVTAIVGSANMDYRSLYLHFENCVAFYGGNLVADAKRDMLESFALGREVTLEDTQRMPLRRRILQIAAKFFAPML